jgi:type VI secretion system protein ImpH
MTSRTSSGAALASRAFSAAAQEAMDTLDRQKLSLPYKATLTLEESLVQECYHYDFFQAVLLMELFHPESKPVGRDNPPAKEVVRFQPHLSLTFPSCAVQDIVPPDEHCPVRKMVVRFFGLYGAMGALPRHYTELLLNPDMRYKADSSGGLASRVSDKRTWEHNAFRAWLDIFNHRLISLFYRAWEKYRFFVAYARGEFRKLEPDHFTQVLFSVMGQGSPAFRNRLRVGRWRNDDEFTGEEPLAQIDDVGLLPYAGLLSQRPRNALNLHAFLNDYFQLPCKVIQFQGQWLHLDPSIQTKMDRDGGNCSLGINTIAGTKLWDIQCKFRLRLGPLNYQQFLSLLPDPRVTPERKLFFLLSHVVRRFIGPELDFDVQLVLKAEEVPPCQMGDQGGLGARLGWNTWIFSGRMPHDVDDPVFEGDNVRWLPHPPPKAL